MSQRPEVPGYTNPAARLHTECAAPAAVMDKSTRTRSTQRLRRTTISMQACAARARGARKVVARWPTQPLRRIVGGQQRSSPALRTCGDGWSSEGSGLAMSGPGGACGISATSPGKKPRSRCTTAAASRCDLAFLAIVGAPFTFLKAALCSSTAARAATSSASICCRRSRAPSRFRTASSMSDWLAGGSGGEADRHSARELSGGHSLQTNSHEKWPPPLVAFVH